MRRALLALLLAPMPALAVPASAQQGQDGAAWALTRQAGEAAGAGHCAASLKDEAGAVLSLWVDLRGGGTGAPAGQRLTLTMTEALRNRLPLPDGAAALALRPAGRPAVLLEGRLAAQGALHVFSYDFADRESQRAFLRAAAPRLTVFHPEAGVIAGFAVPEPPEALAWLDGCALDAADAPEQRPAAPSETDPTKEPE